MLNIQPATKAYTGPNTIKANRYNHRYYPIDIHHVHCTISKAYDLPYPYVGTIFKNYLWRPLLILKLGAPHIKYATIGRLDCIRGIQLSYKQQLFTNTFQVVVLTIYEHR